MKIFGASCTSNIRDYQLYFNVASVEMYDILRATKFLRGYSALVNVLCEIRVASKLSSTQFAYDCLSLFPMLIFLFIFMLCFRVSTGFR